MALGAGALLGIDEKAAQLLVAAGHPRADDSRLGQPLLHRLRAQAAAKTVEQGIWLLAQLRQPSFDTRGAHGAPHQLVAEFNGRRLTLPLVTGAHLGAFVIRHQRQADGVGEGPFLEFDGGAQIDEGNILQEDGGEIPGQWQLTHRAFPRQAGAVLATNRSALIG